MTFELVIILALAPTNMETAFKLRTFDSMPACVNNAQRITEREKGDGKVFRSFKRAHCERIDD